MKSKDFFGLQDNFTEQELETAYRNEQDNKQGIQNPEEKEMSELKKLILKEYTDQGGDVVVTVRQDGTSYATFMRANVPSFPGHGNPSLEKMELIKLIEQMDALEG
jgi:hypothetical protein